MLSTLDRLHIGKSGIIKTIYGEEDIKRRLIDIGLIEGLRVECALISPMNDPKAYWIKGALIALRNEDAAKIIIEENAR